MLGTEVLFYGELFHKDLDRRTAEAARETIGLGVSRKLPGGIMVCREDQDGAAYAAALFSAGSAGQVQAIGFKLFYHHGRDGANATVWDYVLNDRDLKIVHIQRKNWFAAVMSRVRAVQTGTWHATEPPPVVPRYIPAAAFQKAFNDFSDSQREIQPILDSHSVLELEYEDIHQDFQHCMRRLCSFLGVGAEMSFALHTQKLSQLDPKVELVNYDEVEHYFRDTDYARFFR
jgi:LPS sulfotransferase NodH